MADQVEIFNIEFGDTLDSINKLKAELKETRKLFNDAKPNTPEFIKYSAEVKRLDSGIKALNNTTKDQVNALGGINKSAQFASGSYGELKQKIDQQTRALNNLTVGSDDFNTAQEELIKLQAQRIDIEKKIPSLFQERIKLAVDEANTLKSLRAELKAANSAALNGDGKAAARAAELRDQLEDLKDTTNSLKGSGVERLNTSVGLLTQGFADFDTDKIKTGFKGIGAAMSAIPIVLIIEGIKALIDNFDEVVKFARIFTGYIDENAKAVENLTGQIQLQEAANIILISSLENEISIMEAQGVATDQIIAKKKELVAAQVAENDKSIELSKAKIKQIQEESTIYEEAKAGVLNALGFQVNAIKSIVDAEKDRASRVAEQNKNIAQSEAETQKLKTSLTVEQINNNKKLAEAALEKAKKEAEIAKEAQARDAEIQNAEIDLEEKRIKDSLARQKKAGEMSVDIEKEIFANLEALDNKRAANKIADAQVNLLTVQKEGGEILDARLNLLNAQRDQELLNTELTESQKAEIRARYADQEYQIRLKTQQEEIQAAGTVTSSLGDLSNSLFELKRSNLEKGSQEDREAAEKQFNVNKAFSITSALISGAVAVINASASVPYLPVGLAASIAAAATTAASVAKISATKFQYFDGGFTKLGDPTQKAESIGSAQFHNDEYVVPSKVKNLPAAQPYISKLETMRRGYAGTNISGFFDGGFTARAISRNAETTMNIQNTIEATISSMPPIIARISDIDRAKQSKENSITISNL